MCRCKLNNFFVWLKLILDVLFYWFLLNLRGINNIICCIDILFICLE